MDFLDQAKDGRRHDEQISDGCRSWIPIGVRRTSWHEHTRPGASLHLIITNANAEGAFEYTPRLVITVVEM
jgi:hypothetical protein